MRYAVDKAVRRGIKQIPESLLCYLPDAAEKKSPRSRNNIGKGGVFVFSHPAD
jgi:hypothetical protein